VSAKCDTGASNHPQSLWITLWTSSGGASQVAYRKGFFFGRSNFERIMFSEGNQWLTEVFPLEKVCCGSHDNLVPAGLTGGG
jgi:hypothetical protein